MKRISVLFIVLAFAACRSASPAGGSEAALPPAASAETEEAPDDIAVEEEEMPKEDTAPPAAAIPETLPRYNATAERKWDLLHTLIDVRFDWQQQRVPATAQLVLKPYFFADSVLVLDAKNFDIHSITETKSSRALAYRYDSLQLSISLGRLYQRADTLRLTIAYTAKPAERSSMGGSAAITSDQGLFFINHDKSIREKPQQIWTQGETENNSRWFPTIDKPNERATQEVRVTVEDRFATLSNGLLRSSKKNKDGTRTDTWVMDQPHAPYLCMLAIGEFAVERDSWKGIPLEYYVEPSYKQYARDIFAHTPEMLDFFSALFGVPYPWKKYSQVVVRDYVSGAMENTTAVIFGDFVQRTKRQLMDDHNDKIVAHEMSHHWFGNYVTCESWSNLTMNEGFANYSEYLWLEHKYGRREADLHMQQEREAYLQMVESQGTKDLIRFDYEDKEEMFDAHSYNKGGMVLHMLRKMTGDEAFFASLKKYLSDNAYQPVEAHQLRLAFEAVTGQDLNWFFNQWFFDRGHPILDLGYTYDAGTSKLLLHVSQQQQPPEHRAIFTVPVTVDIYTTPERRERHEFFVDQRNQVFEIPMSSAPVDVVFDPERILLAVMNEADNQPDERALRVRFFDQSYHLVRIGALSSAMETAPALAAEMSKAALADSFWVIRAVGLSTLEPEAGDQAMMNRLLNLAEKDPHSYVRTQAIEQLEVYADRPETSSALERIIARGEQEAGYVIGGALSLLMAHYPDRAAPHAARLAETETDPYVLMVVAEQMARKDPAEAIVFFKEKLKYVQGYEAISFMTAAYQVIQGLPLAEQVAVMNDFTVYAIEYDSRLMQRYAIVQALSGLTGELQSRMETAPASEVDGLQEAITGLAAQMARLKKAETNPQLKAMFEYME